jgi:hypothetical protein
MKRLLTALGLVAVSSTTMAQTEVGKEVPAQSGAGAVTFADLDGAVVEASVVLHHVIRRQGEQFPTRAVNGTRIAIVGERLYVTQTHVSHHPGGVSKGKPMTYSTVLEQPGVTRTMGGGHGLWIFKDGILTTLRIYDQGGAFKRDIAFTRAGKGFACKVTEGYAREGGTGSVTFNSPINGKRVTVVSARQTSSSCKVTKRN